MYVTTQTVNCFTCQHTQFTGQETLSECIDCKGHHITRNSLPFECISVVQKHWIIVHLIPSCYSPLYCVPIFLYSISNSISISLVQMSIGYIGIRIISTWTDTLMLCTECVCILVSVFSIAFCRGCLFTWFEFSSIKANGKEREQGWGWYRSRSRGYPWTNLEFRKSKLLRVQTTYSNVYTYIYIYLFIDLYISICQHMYVYMYILKG